MDGLVYVGTTAGKLFGIDPVSFAIRDTLQVPDRILNPPLLARDGEVLVVPVFGNRLMAFRAASKIHGEPISPTGPSRQRQASPAKAIPFSAAVVDSARPEGLYYRIDEPLGHATRRPYSSMPSRRLMGIASFLTMHAPNYRTLSQADIRDRLLPPLAANQVRTFLYGYQPLGMVTWACLTADVERHLIESGKLPDFADWTGGDKVWAIDIIAPFGNGRAMLDRVRREALRGKIVNFLQPRADGSLAVVTLAP